ncbi:hypothetical protein BGZ58_003568 [Dissophora ornata]|nr:hypothetical protein BGZ58_003568 [Dissophora ornata]
MPRRNTNAERRAWKKRNQKRPPKLEKVFECLQCARGKTVGCKILCNIAYSCAISHLDCEVDVYHQWVDTWEKTDSSKKASNEVQRVCGAQGREPQQVLDQTQSSVQDRASIESDAHDNDKNKDKDATKVQAQAQTQTRVSCQAMKKRLINAAAAVAHAHLKRKQKRLQQIERTQERRNSLNQTPIQVGGQVQCQNGVSWDYTVLDERES